MTLEDRYRRRLRLFPKDWRRANEREVLGVLLDAADPGRESVPLADTMDLVAGALRVRVYRRRTSVSAALAVLATSLVVLALALAGVGVDASISPELLATSLIVVLIPGTGVVYTVSSALGGGRRRGLVAAAGCTLGILPHLLAAVLGLSGVMQAGAAAFEVVRWIGVAYLLFMGVSMIRDGGALALSDDGDVADDGSIAVIRRGVVLNLLNPKLTVFFFAFLPQFLDSTPRVLDPRLVVLGAVFMAMTLVVFVGYVYASVAVRDRVLDSPVTLRWVQRALGTLLVGFAVHLAVDDR